MSSETWTKLKSLPLYIEGGDDSLWPCRESGAHWDLIEAIGPELAKRRFVCVFDLLDALGETPVRPEVIPPEETACTPVTHELQYSHDDNE